MFDRASVNVKAEGDVLGIGLECYSANTPILGWKYQNFTAKEVASKQQHLSESEKTKLEGMLSNSKKFLMASLDAILTKKCI